MKNNLTLTPGVPGALQRLARDLHRNYSRTQLSEGSITMAITFTQAELETLSALRQNAQAGAGYWRCYEYIAQQLEAKGVSLTDPALLWFKGATEANAGRGAFSIFIKTSKPPIGEPPQTKALRTARPDYTLQICTINITNVDIHHAANDWHYVRAA